MGPKFIDELLGEIEPGDSCSISGRVSRVTDLGGIVFLSLWDPTGAVQVVLEKEKYDPAVFDTFAGINTGSYINVGGKLLVDGTNAPEINADRLDVLGPAAFALIPDPHSINGVEKRYSGPVFEKASFYLGNPERAAVLKIKSDFIMGLHDYFQKNKFTLVDPPILTNKTLYDTCTAVTAELHGEPVYLTQCATFELEPLAMVFKKVYTISPAFRNESNIGSPRHLAEYTHAKAEMLETNLSELMQLAGESIHSALEHISAKSARELKLLGVRIDADAVHPENHEKMTYNEALEILQSKNVPIEFGQGISRTDEAILTEHAGDSYLWIMYLPFVSEGFPYKRCPKDQDLSMTCDLIAPHGAGEMVGAAEKTTDAEELIRNLYEKGKISDIENYMEYIYLREFGLPPHGGIGAAPERIIYGILGLPHIKYTKAYPRYPGMKMNEDGSKFGAVEGSRIPGLVNKYRSLGDHHHHI